MSIVSIKRFLDSGSEGPLREAVTLLIEKLGECVVMDGDAKPLEEFRGEIRKILESLTGNLPAENVLVLARSVAQAQENYNRRVSRAIEKQAGDFQVIVRMLQDSLVKIAGEKTESIEGLARISQQLERGTAFKDLPSLKQHLGTCLSDLRVEIEREKTASRALIEKLRTEIGSFRETGRAGIAKDLDPATELPGEEDCMAAIRQAIDAGTRHFTLVMVVNRVQRINARFGREAGDRMLCRFKEHAEQQFFASDQLFRWTGPAIIAILQRPEAFDLVRAHVRRMLEVPIQENYEIGDRSVLIPISVAWSLTMLDGTAEATRKQIQTFIASQGGRDYV